MLAERRARGGGVYGSAAGQGAASVRVWYLVAALGNAENGRSTACTVAGSCTEGMK